jgi:integrase
MATITLYKAKDGSISYRVRVQRKGYQTQSATFPTRQEALKWSRMVEGQIVEGRHFPDKKPAYTLAELIERYQHDILPRKQPETQARERYYHAFWNKRLGHRLLTEITKADIVQVRNDFLTKGYKSTSIHRYLSVLSHLLNTAIRDYDFLENNVVHQVQKPPLPPGRVRYLTDEERSRLLVECRKSKNSRLYTLVILAMYTGLRRGNLLKLRRQNIDVEQRTITVERTKNGLPLVLPLVGEAYKVVKALCEPLGKDDHLFPHASEAVPMWSYVKAFDYAVKRAGIQNASFHTLRHCTGSYLVQAGVDLYTVSRILNHKSITMTARYSHLQTDHLRMALEKVAQRLSS